MRKFPASESLLKIMKTENKTFFIFKGLSLDQIKPTYLKSASPTLIQLAFMKP